MTRNIYWTREEDHILKMMLLEGHTTTEVAAFLGRSRKSVQSRKHRLSLKTNCLTGRQPDIEQRLNLIDHLCKGYSLRGYARMIGKPHQVVQATAMRMVREGVLTLVGTHSRNKRYVRTGDRT